MKSTDHNLNNPLRIGTIDLMREVENWTLPNVSPVSQDFYDLLQTKDPNTIYIIKDSKDGRMYFGDHLILKNKTILNYVLGIDNTSNAKYVLYMNQIYNFQDNLIEIARFEDPQIAINTLNLYNNIGSHNSIEIKLYNLLIMYIDESISLHNLITSILCVFGYSNDPRLQQVIETAITYQQNNTKLFNELFIHVLGNYAKTSANELYKFYNDLYNIILKYNFFKDKKYHCSLENLDLSNIISEIINLMNQILCIYYESKR